MPLAEFIRALEVQQDAPHSASRSARLPHGETTATTSVLAADRFREVDPAKLPSADARGPRRGGSASNRARTPSATSGTCDRIKLGLRPRRCRCIAARRPSPRPARGRVDVADARHALKIAAERRGSLSLWLEGGERRDQGGRSLVGGGPSELEDLRARGFLGGVGIGAALAIAAVVATSAAGGGRCSLVTAGINGLDYAPPDMVLYNGKIATQTASVRSSRRSRDSRRQRPRSRHERPGMKALAGKHTRTIDLGGGRRPCCRAGCKGTCTASATATRVSRRARASGGTTVQTH